MSLRSDSAEAPRWPRNPERRRRAEARKLDHRDHDLIEVVRRGLYAATRGNLHEIAPVPGTPVGEAHLALDALHGALERIATSPHGTLHCELARIASDVIGADCAGSAQRAES